MGDKTLNKWHLWAYRECASLFTNIILRARAAIMQPSKPTIAACALVTVVLCSGVWIGVYSNEIHDNNRHDASELDAANTTTDASIPPTTTITKPPPTPCQSSCRFEYVESIPYNMTYANASTHTSTIDCWKHLLSLANQTIDIGSYYWSLRAADVENADYSAQPGSDILDRLIAAGNRGVAIRVAQNAQDGGYADTIELTNRAGASVRSLNFTNWFDGGILHTKFWNVDNRHFYVGSANLDWRSLTQVKELGVGIYDCPCLSDDLSKIFEVYWTMGVPNQALPTSWPDNYTTDFNATNPMSVRLRDADDGNNDTSNSLVYLSSSPPGFRPRGRQDDAQAIIDVIANAHQFVHIAVMDYIPATLYQKENRYWPDIDDALRHAAFDRAVHVRLLMSKWNHTSSDYFGYLNSLAALNRHLPCRRTTDGTYKCIANTTGSIEIKIFEVPVVGNQSSIPYSRVNHNKYMVTDNTAYIGTSNWAGDYFISTAGVGLVIRSAISNETSRYVRTLDEVFMRDWNSHYAKWLDQYDQYGRPVVVKNDTNTWNDTNTCDNQSNANRRSSTIVTISLLYIICCCMWMTSM